jgi:SAM-dependent methyltransferase
VRDEPERQQRYVQLGDDYFWFSGHNTVVEELLRPHLDRVAAAATPRPLRILDVGCGPGNTSRRFTGRGRVVGLDYSVDALAFARQRGVRDVVSADGTALPIASRTIDCVVALEILEHIDGDQVALGEIARILRPGGVFVITVPAFMSLWRAHDEMWGHRRRYTRQELVERVRRAGLEVMTCHYFKCMFFLPMWAMAVAERLRLRAQGDNYVAVPGWLNRALDAEIVWETRSGLARHLPFGSALLCVGRQPPA